MTIRVFVSGLSGNQEVKKRQQRIETVLCSSGVKFVCIDITEAGYEDDRKFMQENAQARDNQPNPIAPQIFNGSTYCGDYVLFDEANELGQLYEFLKLSAEEIEEAKEDLNSKRAASRGATPEATDKIPPADPQSPPVTPVPEPNNHHYSPSPVPRSPTPVSSSPVMSRPDSACDDEHQSPAGDEPQEEDDSLKLQQLRQAAHSLVNDNGQDDGDREVWPRGFSRRNTLTAP